MTYPFSAIVGQDTLIRALLLNAVDPAIGGVLLRGERGTAKSTAVRALPALLPPVAAVEGCPYRCAPDDPPDACPWCAERSAAGEVRRRVELPVNLVELPVAATEDRVAGSFSLEDAIQHGVRRFEPGVLAAANRGILYVDEVNLLPDHLIDTILDAAASGVHRVEREGVSVAHPAGFVLVGTMNPEEGELRPQLLDRFGLAVEVTTPRDPASRMEIVRRRLAYDADPASFRAKWAREESRWRARVVAACGRLPAVRLSDNLRRLIAEIGIAYEVEGLRADVVTYRAAAALAALEGRTVATAADVAAAAELALRHRVRRPFDSGGFDRTPLERLIDQFGQSAEDEQNSGGHSPQRSGPPSDVEPALTPDCFRPLELTHGTPRGTPEPDPRRARGAPHQAGPVGISPPSDTETMGGSDRQAVTSGANAAEAVPGPTRRIVPAALRAHLPPLPAPKRAAGIALTYADRGSSSIGRDGAAARGHYVGSRLARGRVTDLALDATLRAAAPHQLARRALLSELPRLERPAASVAEKEPRVWVSGEEATGAGFRLQPTDLRQKVRHTPIGRLLLFVVDASGSMGTQQRMAFAKRAVHDLLSDAYRRRDRAALIAFGGAGARLVVPPTNSVRLADRRLLELPTGGRTPLAAALELAAATLDRHERRQRGTGGGHTPLLILLSDGKANVPATPSGNPWQEALLAAERLRRQGTPALLLDPTPAGFSLGLTRALAAALGARLWPLSH